MLDTVIKAIRDRAELSFLYGGLVHTVEPHAVGLSLTGSNVLWCFQIQACHLTPGHITPDYTVVGYEWDLFELSQLADLHPTGRHFVGERFGYKRGNRHMKTIFAEL